MTPPRTARPTGAATWLLALEALFALTTAALWVRLRPFSATMRAYHLQAADTGAAPGHRPDDEEAARRVGWAVRVAGRRTPWTSTCLMQSLAAVRMLRRRDVASLTTLGMVPVTLEAHSWTSAAGHAVCGGTGEGYAVVGSYLCPAPRRAAR